MKQAARIPTMGNVWRYRFLYMMFLPAAVYFLLFSYYPFFKGIFMSFQANRLIGIRPFVGFANYAEVIADPDFIQSIINSLIIGIADMALYFCLSLVLALIINEIGLSFVRKGAHTIAYLPYLFSWSVIGGIWALIFDRRGIVNVIRGFFGGEVIFFLADQSFARPLIIGMGVWRSIGYFALLYSVSIVGIDPTLYEAARIDGAGRFTQIRKIILPSLQGTMKVVLVLLSIGILTHFDEIFVMQNPGNKRLIRTLLLYIYETGILNFKLGTATAGAALVMIGTLALAGITRKLTNYDE
ncbi:MAG: ABC transporter permease subunit [Treponema sp.]|jgi:putative aldouronate transport system permease protein|nr:ABC transporter permease subunit [Treponema sp.]